MHLPTSLLSARILWERNGSRILLQVVGSGECKRRNGHVPTVPIHTLAFSTDIAVLSVSAKYGTNIPGYNEIFSGA